MQLNSNLNSMLQLEKQLEKNANELAKLNNSTSENEKKQQNSSNKNITAKTDELNDKSIENNNIKPTQIPIAYSVGVNGISIQNSAQQTVLDIRA